MISNHDITFLDDILIIYKLEVSCEDKEWNTLLNDGLLSHKWLLSHHDPNTDLDQPI